MFKVSRQKDYKFKVLCYHYIQSARFHTKAYSVTNLTLTDLASMLQGRIVSNDSIEDVLSIVLLTNQPAYVADNGEVSAVA